MNDDTIKRLSTGSVELDEILGGGVPEHSLNIVMGEPGSGKTTLAEQLLFANANGDGRPMLYLTTLSEPFDKVIKYLQSFRFFDADKLGTTIHYDALGPELVANGIGALVPRLKHAIKTLAPKLIVIDSFKAIHDLATTTQEMRLMMYEVAGLLTAYSVTVLLVGEYRHEDIATYPEFAIADGIIELARNAYGTRDARYIRVFKLRGCAYRQGSHAFDITPDGVKVFPRLVSPNVATNYKRNAGRIASGVPGLDRMLDGGFPAGSATLVAGPTGAGKTTLAIQFVLAGLMKGERCLLVNFQENPTQLAQGVETISGKLDPEVLGRLELLYYSAVELSIDKVVVDIFDALRSRSISRVVIDALGDLSGAANDVSRVHDYVYALVQQFAAMGVSSVLTLETDPPILVSDPAHGRLSHLTDNIVFLDIGEKNGVFGRRLRVAKARGVAHDLQMRAMQIDARGLRIIEEHK